MAVVLIPVGISVLKTTFETSDFKRLSNLSLDKLSKYTNVIEKLQENILLDWKSAAKKSAEISSLLAILDTQKIQKEHYKDQKIELLCPDTLVGFCAANCITEVLTKLEFEKSNIKISLVEDLQVRNSQLFESKGIPNLLEKIDSIIFEGEDGRRKIRQNVIFNITGGYKVITPHLSILAQIYRVPLFYLFEDTDDYESVVLKLPVVPIQFDWALIELFGEVLSSNEVLESFIGFLSLYQIQTLLDYSMIKESSGELYKYEIDTVGSLMWRHIYQARPESPEIFGYIVEYKMLEYFLLKSDQYGVPRKSYRPLLAPQHEIDILLDKSNIFSFVEVKSSARVVDFTEKDRLPSRINALREEGKIISKFILVLYKFQQLGLPQSTTDALRFLSSICYDYGIEFEVYCLNIKIQKENFKSFLSSFLQSEDIEINQITEF